MAEWSAWLAGSVAWEVSAAAWASPAVLAQRQARRLARLLASAQQHSPMYRRLIGARNVQGMALAELPVVRKPELMAHFDDWVADPQLRLRELRTFLADPRAIGQLYLGRYMVWESSGSTGASGVFVQDAQALAVYDALEALRRPSLQPWRRWRDPWFMAERLAFVGATGGHFASTATVQRLRRLNPWLRDNLRGFSFLDPPARLVAALNAFAPSVLSTYPSAALMLAEQALAGRLQLSLREVWTGGEALTPAMRSVIQAGFGCPVVQSYGASEFLALASECRLGQLHLNSDWVVLESVDEHHRPVPPGVAGSTTLLTNLANQVQPLIRYDLGDRICLQPGRCACGSALPVITVEGRIDDSLSLGTARGATVRLLPLALTTVLEEAGLFDFQLCQTGPRALELRVPPACGGDPRHAQAGMAALRRYLKAQGAGSSRIELRLGEALQAARSGKVPRVVKALTGEGGRLGDEDVRKRRVAGGPRG